MFDWSPWIVGTLLWIILIVWPWLHLTGLCYIVNIGEHTLELIHIEGTYSILDLWTLGWPQKLKILWYRAKMDEVIITWWFYFSIFDFNPALQKQNQKYVVRVFFTIAGSVDKQNKRKKYFSNSTSLKLSFSLSHRILTPSVLDLFFEPP